MKKYRRIIIIFMLVMLNVWITKSEQSRSERIQDTFITKYTTPHFKIKYKMARSLYTLGIENLAKAHSINVVLTKLIHPHKKQKYYEQAIQHRIYAMAAFLECIGDFCKDVEQIEVQDPHYVRVLPEIILRTDLMAKQVRTIAAEIDYLLKKCRNKVRFIGDGTGEQDFNQLVTVMDNYEERIIALSEKYRLPIAG